MQKILLIERDNLAAESVAQHIYSHLSIESEIVDCLSGAGRLLEKNQEAYLAVILNLKLSPENYAPFKKIPTIAVTGGAPVSSRQIAFASNVLDYVPDYAGYNLEYIVQLIRRGLFAESYKMLIVDDEPLSLNLMKNLLSNKGYSVIGAVNEKQALSHLENNPGIRLMIVDGDICERNNLHLIRTVRKQYNKNHLSVIPVCERSNEHQRLTLLRNGANDCIDKPLRIEDFHVRVMLNLQLIELIKELTELSNLDFLSRLYNRRYFFEMGKKLYENFRRGNLKLTLAMIDIDHLKHVNDTYGHFAGDNAIKHVADKLCKNLRATDIIARYGGEEFSVLCTDVKPGEASTLFERIRRSVNETPVNAGQNSLTLTISTGVTSRKSESFEGMIHAADMLLYHAKQNGRNSVIAD